LRNYPDLQWLNEGEKENDKIKMFKEWLQGEDYIYIQGLGYPGRMTWETLSAIMESRRIKAVVIGSVKDEIKGKLTQAYPDVDKYIYYTGQIIQSETAAYIAHCKFSMIFYNMLTPNNRYCEPNRMFQCLGLGKPVIVGCNDSMKSIIEKYGNGLVLKSEGSNVAENVNGIDEMLNNYEQYVKKAEQFKKEFAWEAQKNVFETLFDGIK
jgi:glycosyltransferase involved in cell wall biosynthesis